MNEDVESLDKESSDAGTAGYPFQKSCSWSTWRAKVDGCEMQNRAQSWAYGFNGSMRCLISAVRKRKKFVFLILEDGS